MTVASITAGAISVRFLASARLAARKRAAFSSLVALSVTGLPEPFSHIFLTTASSASASTPKGSSSLASRGFSSRTSPMRKCLLEKTWLPNSRAYFVPASHE